MVKSFTKVRPPKETRNELIAEISVHALNYKSLEAFIGFLLAFFTNVDLRLILDQLEEEAKNRPT